MTFFDNYRQVLENVNSIVNGADATIYKHAGSFNLFKIWTSYPYSSRTKFDKL